MKESDFMDSLVREAFTVSTSQLQFNLARVFRKCTSDQSIALITRNGQPTHYLVPVTHIWAEQLNNTIGKRLLANPLLTDLGY